MDGLDWIGLDWMGWMESGVERKVFFFFLRSNFISWKCVISSLFFFLPLLFVLYCYLYSII